MRSTVLWKLCAKHLRLLSKEGAKCEWSTLKLLSLKGSPQPNSISVAVSSGADSLTQMVGAWRFTATTEQKSQAMMAALRG